MRVLHLTAIIFAMTFASGVSAEPVGRWWAGFGQGIFEYGIQNDSVGSNQIYISCGEVPATIRFTVGGASPKPGSTILVMIGADEFSLLAGMSGDFETQSHVASDNFHAIWDAMRASQNLRVRLATGQTTVFTLKGAAKVLPKEACLTQFDQ